MAAGSSEIIELTGELSDQNEVDVGQVWMTGVELDHRKSEDKLCFLDST